MRRLSLAAALFLGLSLHVAAQDTYAARLAAANAYVTQSIGDIDLEAMVRTMYAPVLDQVRANGGRLSQAQINEIDALYMQIMLEPLRQIMLQQDRVMADQFTLEEINALLAFYTSPVGRSVMTKLPQLVQAQQPAVMAMVQSSMATLVPRLQAILAR